MNRALVLSLVVALLGACDHTPDETPAAKDLPGGKADSIGERPQVEIEGGALVGVQEGETAVYRGIPYAAPPVGDLRWRSPQPPPTWSGVRDASAFGQRCVQTDPLGSGEPIGSEDCLTLNVWAPAEPTEDPLPVMVFIHGGYFLWGSSADTLGNTFIYDGGALSEGGPAIVVTLNYRLGALGFLANRDLVAESAERLAGNFGLLDQVAALEWIESNIAAFGGDPDRVMLFGESAGANSICYLMVSPRAQGLFSRAAIQSGGCYATPRNDALRAGDRLARRLGCDDAGDVAACLREADPGDVATALPTELSATSYWFGPNIDAPVVPEQPRKTIRAGEHTAVPTIIGTNRDEYTTLLADLLNAPIETVADYRAAVREQLGEDWGNAALVEYPAHDFASPERAFVALMGDYTFHCPTRDIARLLSDQQAEPVWRYLYSYRFSDPPLRRYRAGHGFELIPVFGVFDDPSFPHGPSPEDRELSRAMIGHWTRFAASGDPNAGREPSTEPPWPQYQPAADPYLDFDRPITAAEGAFTDRCDFWDSLYSG